MERGKKNARQKSCAVSFCLEKGAKVPWSISFWSEASPRQCCPVFSVGEGEGTGRDIGRSAVLIGRSALKYLGNLTELPHFLFCFL